MEFTQLYKVQLYNSHGHPRDAISDLPRFSQICRLTKYYKISEEAVTDNYVCSKAVDQMYESIKRI